MLSINMLMNLEGKDCEFFISNGSRFRGVPTIKDSGTIMINGENSGGSYLIIIDIESVEAVKIY